MKEKFLSVKLNIFYRTSFLKLDIKNVIGFSSPEYEKKVLNIANFISQQKRIDITVSFPASRMRKKRNGIEQNEQKVQTTLDYFFRSCCFKHEKKHVKRESWLIKVFRWPKRCAYVVKLIAVTMLRVKSGSLAVKDWSNAH